MYQAIRYMFQSEFTAFSINLKFGQQKHQVTYYIAILIYIELKIQDIEGKHSSGRSF